MNINHCILFIKVIEMGSISKVAEQMNISQSALSQQIKSIEHEFHAELLERTSKGVSATDAGKIVFQAASEILELYESAQNSVQSVCNQKKSVRIIATPAAYSYALPCTFHHVKTKYPDYFLEVEVMPSNLIEEKIFKGYGDIGIIIGKPNDKSLTCKKVFSDRILLVASEKMNPPAKITCQDIYQYPLLMLVSAQKTRKLLDADLKEVGVDINRLHIPYTLESAESIKLSAVNGYGLAFLPYMAIKKELYHKQLRIIESDCMQFENEFYSIRRSNKSNVNTNLSKIINYIERILEETIC